MTETVAALNPDPTKAPTNINLDKYVEVKEVILETLEENEQLSFGELSTIAELKLTQQKFDGSPKWYITTLKLDLEARGEIIVDRTSSPQIISLP